MTHEEEVETALDPYWHLWAWDGDNCPPCAFQGSTEDRAVAPQPHCPVCRDAWDTCIKNFQVPRLKIHQR